MEDLRVRGRLTRRKTVQYSATAWVPAHSKVECGAPGLENTLGYEMSPLGTPSKAGMTSQRYFSQLFVNLQLSQ